MTENIEEIKELNRSYLSFFDNLYKNTEFLEKMSSLSSIQEIGALSIEMIEQVVPHQIGMFFLYKSDSDSYEYQETNSKKSSKEMANTIATRDLLDWVMNKNAPVIFPIEEEEYRAKDYKNMLMLPLTFAQNPVGSIILVLSSDIDQFNLEQNKILQIMISQISMAVENFMLINEVSNVKDFMKDVMENIINGIITIDTNNRISFINRNAQFMLNISSTNVMHKELNIAFNPELCKILTSILEQIQQGISVIDQEYEQKLMNDTILPIGISASILRDRNFSVTGYVFMLRDLSLTREVLKLKELDTMKTDFISKVSHELRTPLTSISSYTDALLDGMAETKEEIDSYLKIIQEESQRLISMVNDILDVSKMDAGKTSFNLQPHHVNQIIISCINSINPSAKAKNIEIKYEEENDLVVVADMDKMIQVILNLLSNSIKFTPEGGSIDIVVTDQKSKVRVAIADTGIGMRKEDVDKVFDRFYQIENIKHHQKGTGLGTSICKEIVENHGGKIWITSEFGVGTTVYFTLPKGDE